MSISLSAKNKIGFVTRDIEAPAETDPNFPSWQRCNDMVISWILNFVHSNIRNSVMYTNTAVKVWEELKERFSQGNGLRIYQIKSDIIKHKQGQQSVAVYYTKLKAMWDELSSYNEATTCSCGGLETLRKREDKEKVIQFLMGLNDNYSAIRGQILLTQPLPDTKRVYSLVLQQEKQVKVSLNQDNISHHAMHAANNGE